MTQVSFPTVTTDINQNFFVEALGGSVNPVNLLDRFPDSVYTKALDSLLVKFMYAILGPTGVGQLRQEYLEARLIIEEAGLQTTDLDSLYANAFAFARAAYETYDLDASASLLPAAQRAQILAQDASFRNRAIDFLKGARGGTTLQGLTLVAKSGLNQPVELVENYRALYDHFTDMTLGLEKIGQTGSVYEVIVVPRQEIPQSASQSLTITGEPISGWFTLTYPTGQQWSAYPFQIVSGNTISVPDASRFPAGAFVTLTNLPSTATATQIDPTQPGWNSGVLYAESLGGEGTLVSLGGTLQGNQQGVPSTLPGSLLSGHSYICYVGVAQTTPLPFNAAAADVENALAALPLLGNNINCIGGPLPDQPVIVQFINQLSNQAVAEIQFNLAPDRATGVYSSRGFGPMADVVGNTLDISANVVQNTAGVSANSQAVAISPADISSLYAALDQTRPVTSLFTTTIGAPTTVVQPVTASFTGSQQIEVLRYETGRAVPWPTLDSTHWIEAGVEHEAPTVYGVTTQYQGFHNISNATSYTEQALFDSGYADGSTNLMKVYWDSLIGSYSTGQLQLYPGLGALNSGNAINQFLPADAEAPYPEPLIITTNSAGINVINQVYPVDYMSVQGVPQPAGGLLWASAERPQGVDYLEIDLGSVQAVNYLYFEATNKPYLIDIAYDVLDQSPARFFQPVTITPASNGTTILSLNYRATQLFATVTVNINDALGGMIYTRFLRLGFTKTPVGTVYQPIGKVAIPYSIEVQNLRVGRNVG